MSTRGIDAISGGPAEGSSSKARKTGPSRLPGKKLLPLRETVLAKHDSPNLFQNKTLFADVYAQYRETITGDASVKEIITLNEDKTVKEKTQNNPSRAYYNDIPAGFLSDTLKTFNVGVVMNRNKLSPYDSDYSYIRSETEDFFYPEPGVNTDKFRENLKLINFDVKKPTIFYTGIYNFDCKAGKYLDGHALLCVYFPKDHTADIIATYKLTEAIYPPVPDTEGEAESLTTSVVSVTEGTDDKTRIAALDKVVKDFEPLADQSHEVKTYGSAFNTVIERLYGPGKPVRGPVTVKQPLIYLPNEIDLQKNEIEEIGHCAGWALILARILTAKGDFYITKESGRIVANMKEDETPTFILNESGNPIRVWNATFKQRLYFYRGYLYNGIPSKFKRSWELLVKKWKGGRRRRTHKKRKANRRRTRRILSRSR